MYASVANMIERFGELEMIRLSKPDDRTAETVDEAKIGVALADGAALIDDYLRKRYVVPVAQPPESVVRANCVLARYDLAQGERTEPTEQMRLARKEVIEWLQALAGGAVTIDAPAAGVGSGGAGGARTSDRGRPFSDDNLRGW
ncbi:gp436 family protein [Afifella pfennigii]|uniref:gp436 family protein n=1 Tax=Afifella pfennigii TaxID=209897 RepID=UPI00047ECAD8|nr:DUF1320 domain-containing protein [Afifella pfennigii]